MAKSRAYDETLKETLSDPEEAAEYLNAAHEEGRSQHPRPLVPDAVYLLHPWSRRQLLSAAVPGNCSCVALPSHIHVGRRRGSYLPTSVWVAGVALSPTSL